MHPTTPSRTGRRPMWLIAGLLALVVVAAVAVVVLVTRGDNGPSRGAASSTAPGRTGTAGPTGALPTPNPSPSVPRFTPGASPTRQQLALLADRVGFGAGVTGGAGGTLVHVRSSADSGPGSLRAAVAGNTPRWVVVDHDMTITLSTPIPVGSNKTIDARGHRVEITGPGVQGLEVVGSSNVIIESLVLHDFGDLSKKSDLPDAIHIDNAVGVWIDHNDLSKAGDKLIGVTNGARGITVSSNHFHDQKQVFQIGNQSTAQADTRTTVTVVDNFFDHTGYRNPVVSYGLAHVYNNYYLDWQTYAVRTQRAAQLLLQNNIFAAGSNPRAVLTKPGRDGCNDNKTFCDDRGGSLRISGNLLLDGAKIKKGSVSGSVFTPSDYYRYTARPATRALASTIQRHAGPQR